MDPLKGMLPGSFVGMDSLRTSQLEQAQKAAAKGDPKNAQAEKAATEFEALLLHQMLNSMWSTIPKNEAMGGGQEEGMYRDMYTEAVAKEISEKQSLGIKNVIFKELSKK